MDDDIFNSDRATPSQCPGVSYPATTLKTATKHDSVCGGTIMQPDFTKNMHDQYKKQGPRKTLARGERVPLVYGLQANHRGTVSVYSCPADQNDSAFCDKTVWELKKHFRKKVFGYRARCETKLWYKSRFRTNLMDNQNHQNVMQKPF